MTESLGEGKLTVRAGGWEILYVISGPDGRYNPDIFEISSRNIDNYILGMTENIVVFEEALKKFSGVSNYEVSGSMGMRIEVGKSLQGIYLPTGRFGILCRDSLEAKNLVALWHYAKIRAAEMQGVLNGEKASLGPAHPPALAAPKHRRDSAKRYADRENQKKEEYWQEIGCLLWAILGMSMTVPPVWIFSSLTNTAKSSNSEDGVFITLMGVVGTIAWVVLLVAILKKYIWERE
jgi:hypothetical protein